jgi:biopolymer transport protein ExbD
MARKLRRKPEDNSVPLDMTPMIDCIFLLLIFFILTSKFQPDEKAIASLMPTDKGQAAAPSESPIPKEQVNIKIYPAGMAKGYQPSDYRNQLLELRRQINGPIQTVWVQVGGDDPVEIKGALLREAGGEGVKQEVEKFHSYLHQALDARKGSDGASRKEAQPVVIHCFSGLSWKFALLAYDAVRDYERKASGGKTIVKANELLEAREVMFAPPRIRNYSTNEDGNELYEIIHMR